MLDDTKTGTKKVCEITVFPENKIVRRPFQAIQNPDDLQGVLDNKVTEYFAWISKTLMIQILEGMPRMGIVPDDQMTMVDLPYVALAIQSMLLRTVGKDHPIQHLADIYSGSGEIEFIPDTIDPDEDGPEPEYA